jgi:hypothetical protein
VGGARWIKNIFVIDSQQDRAKRAHTLERKRAKALFVYKNLGTLISTFSELPAFTRDIVSVSDDSFR